MFHGLFKRERERTKEKVLSTVNVKFVYVNVHFSLNCSCFEYAKRQIRRRKRGKMVNSVKKL